MSITPRVRRHGAASCYSPAGQLLAWDDKVTPGFGGKVNPLMQQHVAGSGWAGQEDVGRFFYPCKRKPNNDTGTAVSGAVWGEVTGTD